MKLPIRNYLPEPLTVFIEPYCEQYEIPIGGQATITLQDGKPHSIDVHPDRWVSIWDEGDEFAMVEIFDSHQFGRAGLSNT